MHSQFRMDDRVRAWVERRRGLESSLRLRGWCVCEHRDPNGKLLARDEGENLIVNTGINHILDTALSGSTQITSYYVGLKDTGTPVAADTMASHASWATITPYSNATDPAWTEDNTGSDQLVSNSASPAVFNINATDTVYGAFLKDSNTKGGATGLLVAVKDFSASQAVNNGDTLNVTYQISATG